MHSLQSATLRAKCRVKKKKFLLLPGLKKTPRYCITGENMFRFFQRPNFDEVGFLWNDHKAIYSKGMNSLEHNKAVVFILFTFKRIHQCVTETLQSDRVWADNCPSQKAERISSNKHLLFTVGFLSTCPIIGCHGVVCKQTQWYWIAPVLTLTHTHTHQDHLLTLALIYSAITQTTKPLQTWINSAQLLQSGPIWHFH